MSRDILADYLAGIARIRGTRAGTGEISYYGCLATALNAVGTSLKPRVFCVAYRRAGRKQAKEAGEAAPLSDGSAPSPLPPMLRSENAYDQLVCEENARFMQRRKQGR